jgi:hypothetical protein
VAVAVVLLATAGLALAGALHAAVDLESLLSAGISR